MPDPRSPSAAKERAEAETAEAMEALVRLQGVAADKELIAHTIGVLTGRIEFLRDVVAADRLPDPAEDRCACGAVLVSCHGCAEPRCLTCDPYTEMERANRSCIVVGWTPPEPHHPRSVSAAVSPAEPPEANPEVRWSVSCGCDYHGDHMGCDRACKDRGCRHPVGVEVTAATEAEANARRGLPFTVSQSDIDGGRVPARTMRQIASAVRQDTAGAGARHSALKLILGGGSIHGPLALTDDVKNALDAHLAGLINHLCRIEEKLRLAIEEENRGH